MFVVSGIFNIVAALILVWWSFTALNNVLLLIPAVAFLVIGCLMRKEKMHIVSGIFNIIAAAALVWWSFGILNNVLLLIPAVAFLAIGCLCIAKASKLRKS